MARDMSDKDIMKMELEQLQSEVNTPRTAVSDLGVYLGQGCQTYGRHTDAYNHPVHHKRASLRAINSTTHKFREIMLEKVLIFLPLYDI